MISLLKTIPKPYDIFYDKYSEAKSMNLQSCIKNQSKRRKALKLAAVEKQPSSQSNTQRRKEAFALKFRTNKAQQKRKNNEQNLSDKKS